MGGGTIDNVYVDWVEVAYGYVEDYVASTIPPRDRQEFERFQNLFVPAVKELHATTRDYLIPATDGCQSLFVADGAGKLTGVPGTGMTFFFPLRFPRPALVFELNDADKLKEAFSRYLATIDNFIKQAAASDLGLDRR